MIGFPSGDAKRRFREIAALLEEARDALVAFAEQITDEEYDRSDFKDALERIDVAILKCESERE